MSQRLSIDRRSFKQFLSTQFRHVLKQGVRGNAGDRIDPQSLMELFQIRQEVKSGSLDLNAAINRLVKLTQGLVGARGAGVWLFTKDEIFYRAGAGNASNDERLRLEVISKLATACQLSKDSLPRLGNPTAIGTVYNASHGPDCAKSFLVEPIYQGHEVAGALAAFSDELNAFTERDAANIHLLADVLAQALSKATEAGLKQSMALEPIAMLQLIDRIIPALQRMLENDENAPHSMHGFLQSEPEHKLPAAGMDTKPPQQSHESGEETRDKEAMGGTWTEHEQASPALPGDSATSPAIEDTNVPWSGERAGLIVETSTLWPVVRQKWERTVAFVRNYASRARLLSRAERAGHQVWRTIRYPSDSPPLLTKAAYRDLRWVKSSISSTVKSARNRLWGATKYRPNLPTVQSKRSRPALPKVVTQPSLRHAQYSFLHALRRANSRLQMLLQSRSSLRAPRRAAPILAILVIIITFLILKASLHNTAQTTASSSQTAAQENTIRLSADSTGDRETARSNGVAMAGTPEAHAAEQFGKSAPLQVSHMQVTDRATEDAIRTLSRYELAGLRRRAVYGDDSAAFQMGMAYELGHGVRQSCTTAAQWVARAAGDGNAAAQYNLGVRYRDGDGVPVNENEAVKWLQKAAAQQSPNAQLALMPLTAHRARFVTSRP
jgi:hypothetical protein